MSRKGKCTYIFCPEDGKTVALDARQICPVCGHPQTEVPSSSSLLKTLMIAVVVIAAGVAFWGRMMPKQKEAVKTETVSAERPTRRKARVAENRLLPAGTRLPGPAKCRDCESFYWVSDGKGGRIRRSEGYTTECCQCGSRVAFSDGYYYDIVCAEGRISAKMGEPVKE